MPRRPDIDAAVEHLGRYAARDEWAARRREHLATFLGRIPEHYGLDLESLFEEVHGLGHLASLFGFLDESFLASVHGADRTSVIDEYLRRPGWQETPRARAYLQGIRNTTPSLYEVRDVAWGEWIELRDRLRDGPSQRIAERIEELLRRTRTKSRTSLARLAEELEVDSAQFGNLDDAVLRLADRIFLQVWLKRLLDAARRPLPTLQNTDGQSLLFATSRLPVAAGATAEAERALDALPGWERASIGELRWTWTTGPADLPTILGTARLDGDALVVETNSRERMERALAILRPALGELVSEGLTGYEDPTQTLRDRPRKVGATPAARPRKISAEEAAAVAEALHKFKDSHYRRTLDDPVPMLGNRTPRRCARSKRGRAQLVRWLKEIENGELQQAARDATAPYDMAWMWRELGIEDER